MCAVMVCLFGRFVKKCSFERNKRTIALNENTPGAILVIMIM